MKQMADDCCVSCLMVGTEDFDGSHSRPDVDSEDSDVDSDGILLFAS